ncbi:MAG TPA: MarR family winged helix-turn-helix transcriptional regulator [Gemmatimonadaceae bacterium]|nr:MAG: MarR family transcriptional regulator [Gemmatimonadetes bacterium SCN 70-22]HMN09723.1 MarR family winged helix-turn-helix transcriptional regulator [Gemmatimonadaceae bacterium]
MSDVSVQPDASSPPPPVAEQVTAGLYKLGLALRTHAWRESIPRGLTPTQAQVLALLKASGAPRRLSDVAEEMAVTLPTASDAVKALVSKGLVSKGRAADDARAVALTLTTRGHEEAASRTAGPEFVVAAVAALTPDEQRMLMRILVKMVRTLQERGDIAPARTCVACRFFRPFAHPDDTARPHHCDFVGAAFGEGGLRLDCRDFEAADPDGMRARWAAFDAGDEVARR